MRTGLGAGAGGKPLRFRTGVGSHVGFAVACLGSGSLLGCPQLLDDGFGKHQQDAGVSRQEPGAPRGPDTTPPTVMRSTPSDGTRGVASDAAIEVTFSEAMDTSATEAAYSSTDLPATNVQFSWRERNTVLVIQPRRPLSAPSGSDPAEVTALRYTVKLSSRARDLAGNALAPLSFSFSAARHISQTLQAVTDRALTGNYRDDDTYGVFDCQQTSTSICVGDGVSDAASAYRGFMTFDLRGLPSDRIAIVAAELVLTVSLEFGDPFDTLGALQLESLSFEGIAPGAYEQTPAAMLGVLSPAAAAGDAMNADVLVAVKAAAAERAQFRLRFEKPSDMDGVVDLIIIDQSAARLRVTYSIP